MPVLKDVFFLSLQGLPRCNHAPKLITFAVPEEKGYRHQKMDRWPSLYQCIVGLRAFG